jgi:hypothetical protein
MQDSAAQLMDQGLNQTRAESSPTEVGVLFYETVIERVAVFSPKIWVGVPLLSPRLARNCKQTAPATRTARERVAQTRAAQ